MSTIWEAIVQILRTETALKVGQTEIASRKIEEMIRASANLRKVICKSTHSTLKLHSIWLSAERLFSVRSMFSMTVTVNQCQFKNSLQTISPYHHLLKKSREAENVQARKENGRVCNQTSPPARVCS